MASYLGQILGGALSIGSGSSLGREGPTIHIGAAIASKIAKLFGEEVTERSNAVCAGSSAGLAAAFGSPLAGVTLVLEEIAGGQNEKNFAGRSLLAAALASSIVFALSRGVPSLPIESNLALSWRGFWLSPVIAVVAGAAGLAFQYVTLAIRARSKRSPVIRPLKLVDWHSLAARSSRFLPSLDWAAGGLWTWGARFGCGTEWAHRLDCRPLSLNDEIGGHGRLLWIGRVRWNFCATLIPWRMAGALVSELMAKSLALTTRTRLFLH